MVKQLMKSIREFKLATILTPTFVIGEVIIEALIPFLISLLINDIKAGCNLSVILGYAWKLVVLSLLSLFCGDLAGIECAQASTGCARNFRYDLFTKIQKFSFSNIDKFSSASLVTRLTTDIQNVQMAFMMIIRTAVRAPLNLIFSFTMAYIMGGTMAVIFLIIIPFLGIGLYLIVRTVMPVFKKGFPLFDKSRNLMRHQMTFVKCLHVQNRLSH